MSSASTTELDCYLDVEEKEKKAIGFSSLLRLMKIIFAHPAPLIGGIVMVLIGTFASLYEPRIFGYAIDEAIIPKRLDKLHLFGFIFVGVTCLRAFSIIQQNYFFELLGQRVGQDLRISIFTHFQKLPISIFDKNPAGRLLTRVTNDISSLNEMFSAGLLAILSNFLQVVGILVWLLSLNFRLGLISLGVFPILLVISIYFSRKLKIAYRDSRSKLSALNAFLAENLSGMKVVHLFNRQKKHMERFDRLNHWYADAQVASIRIFALFQPTITICAGISVSLIIWYGGKDTLQGDLKLGVLVAYFSYLLSLFQPIREIADKWNTFLSGITSAERIFSILDWPVEEPSMHNLDQPAAPLVGIKGHIIFENVWFAYFGENWVLRGLSLEIKPGERVGIVGHTGAGKTTLMSLLLRFYEPQKGRILLDGKDIRTFDRRSLRASIGIAQQDVFLFSGTFEENMTFWKKVDPDELKSVLKVLGYERNWNEVLQERGSNLSMGERQVIAFARVMLTHPKIWILDEATSSMDSNTEGYLQKALERASLNCTNILIAHRLATVKSADRIVVLNKGAVIENGDHNSLIQQNGLYARLYRYQQVQDNFIEESSV